MHDPANANFGENTEAKEVWTLEKRWYEGRLLSHVDRLLNFVEAHRNEILAQTKDRSDKLALVEATKAVIRLRGSIHMPSELQDQIQEINREIWYRGEKGDRDAPKIKRDWTDTHAANWRRWRIREYLFVADHCAELLASKLNKQQNN